MKVDRRDRRGVREMTEAILGRAAALEEADRALLEQVLGRGVKPRQIAVVAGRTARSLQRRVAALMQRLTDEEVVYILRQRRHWGPRLSSVATAHFVQRLPMAETARRLGVPAREVREDVAAVRSLLRDRVGSRGREGAGRSEEAA